MNVEEYIGNRVIIGSGQNKFLGKLTETQIDETNVRFIIDDETCGPMRLQMPRVVTSDNGAEFNSKRMSYICKVEDSDILPHPSKTIPMGLNGIIADNYVPMDWDVFHIVVATSGSVLPKIDNSVYPSATFGAGVYIREVEEFDDFRTVYGANVYQSGFSCVFDDEGSAKSHRPEVIALKAALQLLPEEAIVLYTIESNRGLLKKQREFINRENMYFTHVDPTIWRRAMLLAEINRPEPRNLLKATKAQ